MLYADAWSHTSFVKKETKVCGWVDGWVSGWTEWDENMNSSSTTGRIDILFFWNPTVNIINPTRNIRIYKQLRGEKRDFLTNHSRAGSRNTRTRCTFFLLGPSF